MHISLQSRSATLLAASLFCAHCATNSGTADDTSFLFAEPDAASSAETPNDEVHPNDEGATTDPGPTGGVAGQGGENSVGDEAGQGGAGAGGADGQGGSDGPSDTSQCAQDSDCPSPGECVDTSCNDGVCVSENRGGDCTDDGDSCTDDICILGVCRHPDNDDCECELDTDCNDGNPCTDETCVDGSCIPTNNTAPCASDGDPCTLDACTEGACYASLSCSDSTIAFKSKRNAQYVRLGSTAGGDDAQWQDRLMSMGGTNLDGAELFEKVEENGTQFKLQALTSGLYVTLGADDILEATATSVDEATLFEAVVCTGDTTGFNALSDDDPDSFVAAENPSDFLPLSATHPNCTASDWARWDVETLGD